MPPPGTVPRALLALLFAAWVACGLWIVRAAPFGSGTDESIEYVAFAAAKNRWATEADRLRHGIDHFYYPPLYYLAFAPFWSDEPSFVEGYPGGYSADRNYASLAGRRTVSAEYLSRVPGPVERLYRQAKLFSLGLGLACLLALAATLRLLFPGPAGWWVALLGAAPLALLPQFLFYQTLVNNDALLNALAALASLTFTGAVLALLDGGRERRFLALSLTTGACIGLAFLTKMSAAVLLPLVLGLAWARVQADRNLPPGSRFGRAARLLALLAGAILLAGGWWVGYQAARGDWSGLKAHRLAHPWAVTDPSAAASTAWWARQVVQIIRSFYALFSGALYIGVPDLVILAWLALPFLAVAAGGAVAARSGEPLPPRGPGGAARRVVGITFAGVVLCNAGAVLANLRFFEAAYGRLLFPSLVAGHALAAAALARMVRHRPRALAAAALTVTLGAGLLFGWTLLHRLGPAVAQPPEDVRVLHDAPATGSIEPVWASSVEQPLVLPAGNLRALRVDIKRSNFVPQVGAAVAGTLEIRAADGTRETIPLRRTALGDSDFAVSWTEIELARPVRLGASTPARLTLRGTPPAWPPGLTSFRYRCGGGWFPANANGTPTPCALFVAGVYRP